MDGQAPMEPAAERRRRKRRRGPPLRVNLRKAMFVLPNAFTVSSIFCGFYALVHVSGGDVSPRRLYEASLAVFFGIFFDMADGRVARLTRTQSAFGVQLDSLADVITFGVAPAMIAYKWALFRLDLVGVVVGFAYVSCAALRLARFNVLAARGTGGASKFFIGLPTPLAAGLVSSLIMFHQLAFDGPVTHPEHVLITLVVISYLMISNVRYRTFKDAKMSRASVIGLASVLAAFVVMAVLIRPTFALLALVSGYVAYGLFEEVILFRRRREDDRRAKSVSPTPDAAQPESRS